MYSTHRVSNMRSGLFWRSFSTSIGYSKKSNQNQLIKLQLYVFYLLNWWKKNSTSGLERERKKSIYLNFTPSKFKLITNFKFITHPNSIEGGWRWMRLNGSRQCVPSKQILFTFRYTHTVSLTVKCITRSLTVYTSYTV